MTQPTSPRGGAATANGILYQLLWTLLQTTTIDIEEPEVKQNRLKHARIIVEPTNGGDVHVENSTVREVVQLKARTTGDTWSLTEVAKEVLPDLYKATKDHKNNSKYVFVTEGPMGKWEAVYAFFQSLSKRKPTGKPLSSLDNKKKISFNHSSKMWTAQQTEKSIFDDIAKHIREKRKNNREPIETVRQRLWTLLSNFEYQIVNAEQLERNINAALREVIGDEDDLEEKMDALIGGLLKLTKKGNETINRKDFLGKYELDATPLSDWNTHRNNAATILKDDLTRRNYIYSGDCRQHLAEHLVSLWNDKPILAITGQPGVGKTWALYQLGQTLLNEPGLPILLRSKGNTDQDLNKAAEKFRQDIAGLKQQTNLKQMIKRWTKQKKNNERFIILLDNVQNPEEAVELAYETLGIPSIQIAITCPPETAQALKEANDDQITIHELTDFTWQERDRLLKHHLGDHRIDIAADIEDLLRKPLLAGIYCEIAKDDPTWKPTNEYEIIQKFWKRIGNKKYDGETLDGTILEQLALSVLNNKGYPWTGKQLLEQGANSRMITHFTKAGWLQQDDEDHYLTTHDRFLSYAAAKALAEAHYNQKTSTDQLAKTFTDLLRQPRVKGRPNLGYIPMDLLYILLETNKGIETATSIIVVADQHDYQLANALYDELLPTLGNRITPVLFERLKRSTERIICGSHKVIEALKHLPAATVAKEARPLLDHKEPKIVRTGLKILSNTPAPETLDRLWQLHKDMQANPEKYDEKSGHGVFLSQESFAALKAAVRLNPKWLVNTIRNANPANEPIHDLAYLVANLNDNGTTWQETKHLLKEKVPKEKNRAITTCIRVYKDTAEEELLKENLENEADLSGPSALHSLAMINPDEALKELDKAPVSTLVSTRGWHLPFLFAVRQEETADVLHTLITHTDNPLFAAKIIDDPNTMKKETYDFLLTKLEEAIAERIKKTNREKPVLYHGLSHLRKIYRPELLATLNQHRTLEQQLVTLLTTTENGKNTLCGEHDAEEARKLLFIINGDGWTQANNHRLQTEDRNERFAAIKEAQKRANKTTITLLTAISQEDQEDGKHPFEQTRATESLATLGETTTVINAVIKHGLQTTEQLFRLITAPRPFNDQAMQTAFDNISTKPGAALALGIGQRTDKIPAILNTLKKTNNDPEVTEACIHALGFLEDDRSAVLATLKEHLDDPAVSKVARHALFRIGTESAINVLAESAPNDPETALTILQYQPSATALATVKESLTNLNDRQAQDLLYTAISTRSQELIADLVQTDEIAAFLREQAVAPEGNFWFTGTKRRACEGLAYVDPDTAFLAATKALKNPKARDRPGYPYLLVKLDPTRAVRTLLEIAENTQEKRILFAIGRALATEPAAEEALISALQDEGALVRENACLLAAKRIPSAALVKELRTTIDDPITKVGSAAIKALEEIKKNGHLALLSEELPGADRDEQWVLLDILLRHGDPGDAGASLLPWQRDLGGLPAPMQQYAREQIRKRRKKLADKMKNK